MKTVTTTHGMRAGDTLRTGSEPLRVISVNGNTEDAPRSWAWLIALAINVAAGAGLVVIGFLIGIAWHLR